LQDTTLLLVEKTDFPQIKRIKINTLQVNLGYKCNLSCTHCHVNAGPNRTELMDAQMIDLVKQALVDKNIQTLDLTGGAPELNPYFKDLVRFARQQGIEVIDRCNLTILLESGQEALADFLASQSVTVVASLPCYEEQNVNQQRGKGVYDLSIEGLKILNDLGYGHNDKLNLHLVYNPNGAFLPPPQQALQEDYKQRLLADHGIVFNELFTITNMPISRFGAVLLAKGQYHDYLDLLKANYSQDNLATVMCRELVSVDYQGYLYDCDFNQMLDQPIAIASDRSRAHLSDWLNDDAMQNSIVVGEHCYGCTAGQGSSCGGALVE